MLVLWEQDDITVSDIGERLFPGFRHADSPAETHGSAGLILRQRSRQDERQVAVTLSDAGRALQQQAVTIPTPWAVQRSVIPTPCWRSSNSSKVCANSCIARKAVLYASNFSKTSCAI